MATPLTIQQLDSTGDLLCLIVDLNPLTWALSAQGEDSLSLSAALDQVLIFCNSHLSLRHENQLAVFGCGFGKSKMLFSSPLIPLSAAAGASGSGPARSSNGYQQFSLADEKIAEGIKNVLRDLPSANDKDNEEFSEGRIKNEVGLVSALAMALCHINRLNATTTLTTLNKTKPRICILSVTEDASSQYVPIMNCIFSAQKNSIPIDVCKIYGPDAVFLQQACHLTLGNYFKIMKRNSLLQYLIMIFLPGIGSRKNLILPSQDQVDLRAACFCHRNIIDIGYVCSVCLSIFCSPLPVCTTCRTKFPMSTLKRLGFGAKPPPSTNGNGNGNGVQRVRKKKIVTASGTASPAGGMELPPLP